MISPVFNNNILTKIYCAKKVYKHVISLSKKYHFL